MTLTSIPSSASSQLFRGGKLGGFSKIQAISKASSEKPKSKLERMKESGVKHQGKKKR